jgi:hypothetical protein
VADRSKLTAMISSEVQRTLVKSPPELWAEISDPEALARHLGEFGEIRITRVQPEQKVEWEGDRASGTVVIKPSGWGTKVKLTVTRDLALDSDDVAALDDGDRPDTELVVAPPAPERAADTAAAPEGERETQLDSASETEPAPELEPVADRESAPDQDSASEAEATPALEPAAAELPPAAEADLSTEPEAALTAPPASAIEPEPDRGATDRSERESAPAARRGFFARLFGRRRGIAPQPPAAPVPQPHRDDPPAPIAERRVAVEPVADEPVAEERVADERVAQEPIAEALSAEPPTVEEPTGDVPAADDLALDDLPADDLTRDEAADEPIADHAVGLDPEAGEATEGVTAEQVEAVLTGVLDRLGAAHHRPFSRS